jgi:hypothetical protein
MKRCRKQQASHNPEPTADQIRGYMQALAAEHQEAWQKELTSARPEWIYLLALHLRMTELEHLDEAAVEFL